MRTKIVMTLQKNSSKWILTVLNVLVPLFVVLIMLLLYEESVTNFFPRFNDEVCWWQQANAVASYGRPLGYWGYNGGTAPIGTFATWGPAAVLPYGLWGFLFGWKLHSYIYANVVFMSLATLVFILLTKIDTKGLVALFFINCFQVVRNYYLLTAMAEVTRDSLGLIAAGLIFWLYKNKDCNNIVKYVLIPAYLFYISQAYLILSIFVVGYMYCILGKYLWWKKLGGGLMVTLLFAAASYRILLLFSSPFPSGNITFVKKIYENKCGLIELLLSQDSSMMFFKWFVLSYFILIIVIISRLFLKINEMKISDKMIYGMSEIILLAFLGGHILFYNTSTWTLVRGLSIGLLLALFLLCLSEDRVVIAAFIICVCFGSHYLNDVESVFLEGRFATEECSQK